MRQITNKIPCLQFELCHAPIYDKIDLFIAIKLNITFLDPTIIDDTSTASHDSFLHGNGVGNVMNLKMLKDGGFKY